MKEHKNSDIFLRPRFWMEFNENEHAIIEKFKSNLNQNSCKYCSKIVDGHIVIDVPKEDNYFWSPQLNIEIEPVDNSKSIVKGLFGPKPQVWTLFMFIHFGVAVAFIGFSIMAYVQYSLKTDYSFALLMVIALPVFWIVLYILGTLGKRTGRKQMEDLEQFMLKTLEK